jgi:pyruvate/2-oxoglutarate dehydrogenase complex dihydrolipoamide acyltransferase (E2) component
MTPVILFEDAWEGDEEAALTNWFFDDGATVTEGALIAEVMVAKAAYEVHAPASGRLKILAPIDAVVRKGTVLAEIR